MGCGQERFHDIASSYYRNASGVLLVYDITSHESFESVLPLLQAVRAMVHRSTTITLVGNKSDLDSQRQVSYEEGQEFAHRFGLIFFELSSDTGTKVNDVFVATVKTFLEVQLQAIEQNNQEAEPVKTIAQNNHENSDTAVPTGLGASRSVSSEESPIAAGGS